MSNEIRYPADWQPATLGMLAEFLNGYPFKPKDWNTFGIPIVRIAQMTDITAGFDYYPYPLPSAYQIDSGDLLFSWSATLLSLIWARGPAYVNQHIYKVIPKGKNDISFLNHLLNWSVEALAAKSHGTTMRHVTRDDLLRFGVTVPLPEEQSRIAVVLDTVDEAIEKADLLSVKLQNVRTGLLRDLLSRGLDEHFHLRDEELHPEQFKDSSVGRIPAEWDVATLVSRVSLPKGQVDPRIPPYSQWILVAPDHIESGTGRLISAQTAAEQRAISGKYQFQAGDVLYSKIRPYLRKAVLAEGHGLCSADMYPLRPDARTHPQFLLAVILGDDFSRFASAVSMRSGFPKINRAELSEFVRAWPQPDEQERIVATIMAFDMYQISAERERNKLLQIKEGLVDDLLSGRVRVPELLDFARDMQPTEVTAH